MATCWNYPSHTFFIWAISQPCWITGRTTFTVVSLAVYPTKYGYIPSTSQCAMSWRHGFWSSQHGIHGIPQFRYESWWMQARPLWANIYPYGQNNQFGALVVFSLCPSCHRLSTSRKVVLERDTRLFAQAGVRVDDESRWTSGYLFLWN